MATLWTAPSAPVLQLAAQRRLGRRRGVRTSADMDMSRAERRERERTWDAHFALNVVDNSHILEDGRRQRALGTRRHRTEIIARACVRC